MPSDEAEAAMKRFSIATLALLPVLTGCKGTPVGDAIIGQKKLAAMDDQYCRSIGAKPGSDAYVQCRMFQTTQREQSHRLAFQHAGVGLQNIGANMQMQAAMNRPRSCTTTASSTFVNGTPTRFDTTCY